jgi:hypothetical protein
MDEELLAISEEIFTYIMNQLTFHLRFMDPAINRFARVGDTMEYRCDGLFFHYSPIALIRTFRSHPEELIHGYLHVVLHSVFQHLYFSDHRRMSLWNLAADMAVENVILELGLECTKTEADEERKRLIAKVKEKASDFTAQVIYHVLEGMKTDEIRLMAPVFSFDNHEIWYDIRDAVSSSESLYGEENRDDPTKSGRSRFDAASHDSDEKSEGEPSGPSDEEIRLIRNALKDWKEISEKIEADLETFHKEEGERCLPWCSRWLLCTGKNTDTARS